MPPFCVESCETFGATRHDDFCRLRRSGCAHVGGQICAPSPLEFLLSGAVGCYAAVFAFYAAKMGIAYDSFEAVARSEFDVRGHMIADAPSSAFRKVTISISVVSDAPAEQLREVERLALAGCPGISTLREPVPVETSLAVTRTRDRAASCPRGRCCCEC